MKKHMSLLIEILVFVFLALLGLDFFRRLIRWFVPRTKELYLDIVYLIFVVIGIYLYFPQAEDEEALRRSLTTTERELSTAKKELDTTKKESRETKQLLDGTRMDLSSEKEKREKATTDLLKTQNDLINAQKELSNMNKRESLRRWAMLLPNGDEAHDDMGRNTSVGGKRSKDFSKVFQPMKGGGFAFAGARCDNTDYIEDIRRLMRQYEKSPYPRVALSYCLKRLGDESWKKEAAQAKADLEFYMGIEPHVVAIDAFYGGLMKYILDDKLKLEDTGFFVRGEENVYRPKNMPP